MAADALTLAEILFLVNNNIMPPASRITRITANVYLYDKGKIPAHKRGFTQIYSQKSYWFISIPKSSFVYGF